MRILVEPRPRFVECFAGAGMARLGLGPDWRCVLANDIDPSKCATYQRNFPDVCIEEGDISDLPISLVPDCDLLWASPPCQDISLAGNQAGLNGAWSGAFWPFWRLVEELATEGRAPTLIVIENVRALLTSNRGADIRAIMSAMAAKGYQVGAVMLDAAHFLPQSRERVFIIGVRDALIPEDLLIDCPDSRLHPAALCRAVAGLPHLWWRLPPFPTRALQFADLLEADGAVPWHAPEETARLLSLLSAQHAVKLAEARQAGKRVVAAGFKRGRPRQQLELRFDGLVGALRTAAGGSSRQLIVVIEPHGAIRSRLVSPREAARLMGLPGSYHLPGKLNEALSLCGDGVCVPVVRFLSENLLAPLIRTAPLTPWQQLPSLGLTFSDDGYRRDGDRHV